VLRPRAFTMAELVAGGGVAADLVPVLGSLVAARANVLVSGATGTGKTTLLNISERHMFGRWRSQVAKRSARRVRHGGYPSWVGRRNCLVG